MVVGACTTIGTLYGNGSGDATGGITGVIRKVILTFFRPPILGSRFGHIKFCKVVVVKPWISPLFTIVVAADFAAVFCFFFVVTFTTYALK